MQKFRIEFETDLKFSLNKVWGGGNGMQWIRKAMATNWHYWTEVAIEAAWIKRVTNDVVLLFFYSFQKNMLDASNCVTMSKMIEDTLVKSKILAWDTNATVRGVYNVSIPKPLSERKLMTINTVDVVIIEEWDKEYAHFASLETKYNNN